MCMLHFTAVCLRLSSFELHYILLASLITLFVLPLSCENHTSLNCGLRKTACFSLVTVPFPADLRGFLNRSFSLRRRRISSTHTGKLHPSVCQEIYGDESMIQFKVTTFGDAWFSGQKGTKNCNL